MGIDFRDSKTIRYVRFGKRTVKAGEAVAVWDAWGNHTQIVGPQLVRLWYSTVRFLDRFVAGPNEYLEVSHRDGRVEHLPGPQAMFCNPVHHAKIRVKKCVLLANATEVIVVYKKGGVPEASLAEPLGATAGVKPGSPRLRLEDVELGEDKRKVYVGNATVAAEESKRDDDDRDDDDDAITTAGGAGTNVARRVVTGPAIYMPEVGEWLHEFTWTATGPANHRRSQTAPRRTGGAKEKSTFSVLGMGQRDWEAAVPFRTTDSAEVTARLSLNFRVQSLVPLLDLGGHFDVVAALQSLLTADLGPFGATIRSDDLLGSMEARNEIMLKLGDVRTYEKLAAGARRMGLEIVGLALLGLDASPALQQQFAQAIRTKARLATEAAEMEQRRSAATAQAEQEQRLADMRLANERRRMENEQAISASKLAHRIKLTAQEHEQHFAHEQRTNEQALEFLKGLKENGVDLTKYLTSCGEATANRLAKASMLAHLKIQKNATASSSRWDEVRPPQ